MAVEQSFERMGFGVSHDGSGYAYMPQQMSTQSVVNINQFTTSGSTAAYPNGNYVSSHHHQVAMQVFFLSMLITVVLVSVLSRILTKA